VHVRAGGDLVGQMISVQITRNFKHSLEAEMTEGAPAPAPARAKTPFRLRVLADG